MVHLSHFLITICLGIASSAPRVIVQGVHQETHCRTEYITMCRIEYETFYETECSNYEEDCEYHCTVSPDLDKNPGKSRCPNSFGRRQS